MGNKSKPEISVIIPTHDRAKYITDAVESVLNQTYHDFELIIIDDGSTDKTAEVLKPYKKNIKYIYQENHGVSSARNAGIWAARGNWLAFLDSDDEWFPEKLQVQMTCLRKNQDLIAHTVNVHYSEKLNDGVNSFTTSGFPLQQSEGILVDPFPYQMRYTALAMVQSILCRKNAAINAGLFDESLSINEDYNFMCRLALQGPWGYTSRELVMLHRREENIENLSARRFKDPVRTFKSLQKGYEEILRDFDLSLKNKRLVQSQLSKTFFTLGMEFLRRGDRNAARKNLRNSILTHFSWKAYIAGMLTILPSELTERIARAWSAIKSWRYIKRKIEK